MALSRGSKDRAVRGVRAVRTQRVETILDGALRLFSGKGFDGTTITEIEREAGLSPGTGSFYRHFPSKEAVFTAVIEREIARSAALHKDRAKWPRPAFSSRRDGMALAFHETLQGFARHEALIRILGREGSRLGKLRDSIRRTMLDQWAGREAAVIGSSQAGGIDHEDPEALALVVISALSGYHLARRFFGAPITGIGPDRFAAALADLLCAPTGGKADDKRAHEGRRMRTDSTRRRQVARVVARQPSSSPR
jgi:AcrR family transcriptional regulator